MSQTAPPGGATAGAEGTSEEVWEGQVNTRINKSAGHVAYRFGALSGSLRFA
jgi:hypothetical protein